MVKQVRTITGEYLVAMKLMAYRQYKHDLSDIVGILMEQQNKGEPLTFERIDKAVKDLYNGWEKMPDGAMTLLKSILDSEDLDALYEEYVKAEVETKDVLIKFEEEYPDVLSEDNLENILQHLQEKQRED